MPAGTKRTSRKIINVASVYNLFFTRFLSANVKVSMAVLGRWGSDDGDEATCASRTQSGTYLVFALNLTAMLHRDARRCAFIFAFDLGPCGIDNFIGGSRDRFVYLLFFFPRLLLLRDV